LILPTAPGINQKELNHQYKINDTYYTNGPALFYNQTDSFTFTEVPPLRSIWPLVESYNIWILTLIQVKTMIKINIKIETLKILIY
jgi:hypothetical protein